MSYTKNDIVRILMQRDELTEREARALVGTVQRYISESPQDAEEILADELGLELDYIFAFV